jgi:predicted nucleic acid-binding protein
MSEMGLIGGTIYDALIAKVAQKAKVERLLTLNINHFRRGQDEENKIIAP